MIAIFGRLTEKTDVDAAVRFFAFLQGREVAFLVYLPYWMGLCARMSAGQASGLGVVETFERIEDIRQVKFVYSFGGDGTVLEAVRFVGRLRKPVFGVNFGRLGYLTGVMQGEVIAATESLLRDNYRIDERTLLWVDSEPGGLFGNFNYGINDLTIHKANSNEMITVHTYVNGEFLNSYWGDGLVISTPTGSTAYNLACGGPIVFPNAGVFVITPVAPHSLTARPVVIPDNCVVTVEVESRSGSAMVALDTRTELVQDKTSIAIRRADFNARLIRLPAEKYIDNLRQRLMWGSDKRN